MSYEEWEYFLEENYAEMIENRRYLHQYPELSFQETKTRAFILEKLKEYGYQDIQENVGSGGIIATLDTGKSGKTLGFRADFDALPIQEETEFDFSSKIPGVMHACGHDAHTATLLGVAKLAIKKKSGLKGKLIFIFQPAEELPPGGAKEIVASGVLDEVDEIYGLHVRGNQKYNGKIGYCPGFAMAASDIFEIKIQGKGGHGASPHTSIDPTVIAAFLIQQLQTLISREKDPAKSGVLTIAVFQSGSKVKNVIADTATLKGTVRTFNHEIQSMIEQRMKEMTRLICEAYGASGEVQYHKGYPAVYNHPKNTELVAKLYETQYGEKAAEEVAPAMGGEDFAYYLKAKPGTFFFVPAGIPEQTVNYPHHHSKFSVDERSMLVGAKAFSLIIVHHLTDETIELEARGKK